VERPSSGNILQLDSGGFLDRLHSKGERNKGLKENTDIFTWTTGKTGVSSWRWERPQQVQIWRTHGNPEASCESCRVRRLQAELNIELDKGIWNSRKLELQNPCGRCRQNHTAGFKTKDSHSQVMKVNNGD